MTDRADQLLREGAGVTPKPHSVLDEARALIAEWEKMGVVEQMRHGDDIADAAMPLLAGLLEQLEAARDLTYYTCAECGGRDPASEPTP